MNRHKLALIGSAIELALDEDMAFVESMRIQLKNLDKKRSGPLSNLQEGLHTFGIHSAPESCSSALERFLK